MILSSSLHLTALNPQIHSKRHCTGKNALSCRRERGQKAVSALQELGSGTQPANRPVWRTAHTISIKRKTGTLYLIAITYSYLSLNATESFPEENLTRSSSSVSVTLLGTSKAISPSFEDNGFITESCISLL